LDGILRIRGGSYWDYWFTESEVLRVKLVSQSVLLIALLLMLTLTVVFGVIGALLGLLALLLVYLRIGRTARKRRSMLEGKTVDELLGHSRMIDLRIPYSEVSRAELATGKLTLLAGHRKIRIKILPTDFEQLRAHLQSKLGEKLVMSPNSPSPVR
jgi:hypothetical protein